MIACIDGYIDFAFQATGDIDPISGTILTIGCLCAEWVA